MDDQDSLGLYEGNLLLGGLLTEVGNLTVFVAVDPDVRTGTARTLFEHHIVTQGHLAKPEMGTSNRQHAGDLVDIQAAASTSTAVLISPYLDFRLSGSSMLGAVTSVAWRQTLGSVASSVEQAIGTTGQIGTLGHWNASICTARAKESASAIISAITAHGSVEYAMLSQPGT